MYVFASLQFSSRMRLPTEVRAPQSYPSAKKSVCSTELRIAICPVIFLLDVIRQLSSWRDGLPFAMNFTSFPVMVRAKSAESMTQPTLASPVTLPPTQEMFTQSARRVPLPVFTLDTKRPGVPLWTSWHEITVPDVPVLHWNLTPSLMKMSPLMPKVFEPSNRYQLSSDFRAGNHASEPTLSRYGAQFAICEV